MSVYQFKLPDIGEGIAEAEIVAWHVKIGDRVEEDQQLADMMTDKATVEMESPVAGVVKKLAGEVGDQIAIGSVLVEIETKAARQLPGGIRSRALPPGKNCRWPMGRRCRPMLRKKRSPPWRRLGPPKSPFVPSLSKGAVRRSSSALRLRSARTRLGTKSLPPPPSASARATSASTSPR